VKIALHGYGRMGRAVEKVALERNHEIVAVFDRTRRADHQSVVRAEVVIDFSNASLIKHAVEIAAAAGVNLVIGTTGWNAEVDAVRERWIGTNISVVYAANFSVGANVLFALARNAAQLLADFPEFEVGIEERHHSLKKDAPSGTASSIADIVSVASDKKLAPSIASSRVGKEFGLHTIFFDSPDDLLEISHRARSREGFARGAVLAAEMLSTQPKGFYTFESLLSLQKAGE